MHKIITGLLVATSLLFSGAAYSAQINGTTAIVFTDNTADFGATFGTGTKQKTFLENYTFTYSHGFDVTSAVISIALGTKSGLNITNFTLTDSGNNVITGVKTTAANLQSWVLSGSNLLAGAYKLSVLGVVTGTTGGSFGGNINISPVPEASVAAMMLGGLALIGFIATRRRNVTPSGMLAA